MTAQFGGPKSCRKIGRRDPFSAIFLVKFVQFDSGSSAKLIISEEQRSRRLPCGSHRAAVRAHSGSSAEHIISYRDLEHSVPGLQTLPSLSSARHVHAGSWALVIERPGVYDHL